MSIILKDHAIVYGLQESEYRKSEGLSQSILKEFIRSPRHYIHACETPFVPTPDMQMGSAFHSLMLDDAPQYAVKKKVDGRTTEGKKYNAEFDALNAGEIIINEEQEQKVFGMRDSFLAGTGEATNLYKETYKKDLEIALYATAVTEFGDVRLKGRLDGWHFGSGTIWDFKKSGTSAEPHSFERMVRDRGYWVQAAMYEMLARASGLDVQRFVFIPVEDEPPHGFAAYSLNPHKKLKYLKNSPSEIVESAISRFAWCQKNGIWNGYPDVVQEIEV